MGCDIHMVAQRRTRSGWETRYCPRDLADPIILSLDDCDWFPDAVRHAWYEGRSYVLFAVLAGVRNGFGFAGVRTHTPLAPISEPRGLPEGFEVDGEREHDGQWMGDHSHSWLTLREIKAFDWSRPLLRCGVVPFGRFRERVQAHGYEPAVGARPYKEWSGGISGPGIYTMGAADALAQMRGPGVLETPDVRPHVRDEWSEPIADCVGDFLTRTVPALETLGTDDEVRIVFGFDS